MEAISYERREVLSDGDAIRVELGCGVTLSIDGDDPDVLVFVDPNQYSCRTDILSPRSPIGEAVAGASVGDVVAAPVGPA